MGWWGESTGVVGRAGGISSKGDMSGVERLGALN